MQYIESTVDLLSDVIELDAPASCYPLPSLKLSGQRQMMTFRTVTLENDWSRIVVCPDLGGRVLELTDIANGTNVLPSVNGVLPEPIGRRGVAWRAGLQWFAGFGERANALAPILYDVIEHDDGLTLVMMDLDPSTGLSTHITMSLDADSAGVRVAGRCFNRTFFALPGACGLLLPSDGRNVSLSDSGAIWHSTNQGSGIAIQTEPGLIEAVSDSKGAHRLDFFAEADENLLGPRASFEFELTIYPLARLEPHVALGPSCVLSVGEMVQVRALTQTLQGTIEITAQDHQKFAAPLSIDPAKPFESKLAGGLANPLSVCVKDADGAKLVEWPMPEPIVVQRPSTAPGWRAAKLSQVAMKLGQQPLDPMLVNRAAKEPSLKPACNLIRATERLSAGEWQVASELLESSLAAHDSDPIAWWMLAICRRNLGDDDAAADAMVAAHFVAPLDPVLRAESFLSQPLTMDKHPSPLVAPIVAFPDFLVDVACHLIESGLHADAVRWLDECLRHGSVAALHDLMAYCHMVGSKLDFEVASHLAAAQKCETEFPLPARNIHRHAVRQLSTKHPSDGRLAALVKTLDQVKAAQH